MYISDPLEFWVNFTSRKCSLSLGKDLVFRASFINDETIRWFRTKYKFSRPPLIINLPKYRSISLLLDNLLVHMEILIKETVKRYILSWILNIFFKFAFKFIARAVLFQMFILFVRNCKMMPIFKRFARFFYGFLGFAFTFFLAVLSYVGSNSISLYTY
jgi:hypothetical protein